MRAKARGYWPVCEAPFSWRCACVGVCAFVGPRWRVKLVFWTTTGGFGTG